MSCPCSPERAVACSPPTCLASSTSATATSTRTVASPSKPASTTAPSRKPPSSKTSRHLIRPTSRIQSTSSAGASHVSPSAKRAKDGVQMIPETSGRTPFAYWSNQEHRWVSLRMSQASLLDPPSTTSSTYSAAWPKAGSMRSGHVSERTVLEPPISASGSGFWPTATAVTRECDEQQWEQRRIQQRGTLRSTYLQDAVKYQVPERTYPTPNFNDFKAPNKNAAHSSGHGLAAVTKRKMLPTPKGSDANGAGCHGTGGPNLVTVVSGGTETQRTFGTPLSTDGKGGSSTHKGEASRGLLRHQVQHPTDSTLRLNADWEDWLMGWPVGWEATQPLSPEHLTAWRRLFLYALFAFGNWVTDKSP